MQQKSNKNTGFTLLEILVALAVLAVASAGLVTASSQNVHNAGYLENTSIAYWVAENKFAEMQVAEYPVLGTSSDIVTMAKRSWLVETEVSSTWANI